MAHGVKTKQIQQTRWLMSPDMLGNRIGMRRAIAPTDSGVIRGGFARPEIITKQKHMLGFLVISRIALLKEMQFIQLIE